MGFLDGLLGSVMGGQSTSTAHPIESMITQHVLGMITNQQTGGLSGLLQKFQAAGLGTAAQSWVGNGPNQPISAQQIQSVLGNPQIEQMAAKFGIPADQVAGHLAQILPGLINHLTPNGQIPQQSALQSAVGMLAGKLFSK
jgi:uncharacterized protein YidB (DUF937 family)